MSEPKVEWRGGRLCVDGEPLPVLFKTSGPHQGSRIVFDRLTPEESAVIEAAIRFRRAETVAWVESEVGSDESAAAAKAERPKAYIAFIEAVDALLRAGKK